MRPNVGRPFNVAAADDDDDDYQRNLSTINETFNRRKVGTHWFEFL